jgi:hypothetical protein
MPQIPLVERRVLPTAEVSGVQASPEEAAAPFQALAQVGGKITDIGVKEAERRSELGKRLEREKIKTERRLLELDIKNRIGIEKNAYESELDIRNDYRNFGTNNDESFGNYSSSISEFLSDERLLAHPDLLAELKIYAQGEVENSRINAGVRGTKNLHDQTNSLESEMYDQAIKSGNAESAISIVENSVTFEDAEKAEKLIQIPNLIQSNSIDRQIEDDPNSVIDMVNAQLAGKESYWDALDNDDLKSKKSYANQILQQRRQGAMDDLYTPGSEYQKLDPSNKQIIIDYMHSKGEISSKAWKAETDRIENPRMADIRPRDNRDYLAFQSRLFAASGNPQEQTKILDEITASGMPMPMRTQLYDLQRDIASPTGKTKSASYNYARETLSAVFGRSEVVAEVVPYWKIWEDRPTGFTDESREDLVFRAHAEAESELFEWMRATPDFTEAQINSKVYSIVSQKSKEYGISQIPARLEEGTIIPEAEEVFEPTDEERVLSEEEQAALDWARENPDDDRSKQILERLEV